MSAKTEYTEIVNVDVPPDVEEKAVELADREDLAIEDVLNQLVDVVPGWDYPPRWPTGNSTDGSPY